MKMKTPGFSAEVVLDPAIQHKHYGGLFAGTSDQSGVTPQLSMSDVLDWILSGAGGAIGGAVGTFLGNPAAGSAAGTAIGKDVGCYIRTGKPCPRPVW